MTTPPDPLPLIEQAAALWLEEHPWTPGTPTSGNAFLIAAERAFHAAERRRLYPLPEFQEFTDRELADEIGRRNKAGRHLHDHAEGWVSE